jgi:nucleoid DNA-binding protein
MSKRTAKFSQAHVTYAQIINSLCQDPFLRGRSFTRKETRYVIDIFLSAIEREVCTKGEVKVPGFGVFYKKMYHGRWISNCNMKEKKWVPPFFDICFTSGARMKLRLGAKITAYAKLEERKRLRESLGLIPTRSRIPVPRKILLPEGPLIETEKPKTPSIKVDD